MEENKNWSQIIDKLHFTLFDAYISFVNYWFQTSEIKYQLINKILK